MSKSFKKLVAIVSAIAMVIAGITVQPQTANAAEALEWSELTDGLGKATIKDTSTEEVRGAEYKGFETDRSWGGDSKWQGQAKVNDVTVEAGQAYKVSLDVSSTPAKKILVQTLSGGEYVEKEYDTTVGHIEQTFVANNDKVNIIVAFGSFSDDEVGTYDVSISNLKLEKTEKSEEQIEKERVEALLTGDKNIAKGKTAFSNSVKEKDYQPEEAFDGNLGLRYAAASYESGVTLGVDLGKTYKVSSVAFKWENAYATEYNIQVSKDGGNWTTLYRQLKGYGNEVANIELYANARYVRMYGYTRVESGSGFSIKEMKVYKYKAGDRKVIHSIPNLPDSYVVSNGKGTYLANSMYNEKAKLPVYKTDNVKSPIASNDWWQSMLINKFGNLMSTLPMKMKYSTKGLGILTATRGWLPDMGSTDVNVSVNSETETDFYILPENLDTATACDKVSGYGDYSVTAQLADDNHVAMTSTFVKGSPYIYTEYGDTRSVYINF